MENNVDEGDTQNRILNPLEISSRIINKDSTDGFFFYITHAFKRCSKFFTPYAFKLVSHKDVNQFYMTVSANGVTLYRPDEMVFISLSAWCLEYEKYRKLMELRLFCLYRKWKAFYVWIKNIKIMKISKTMRYIEENLFFCDDDLREALLTITTEMIHWPLAEHIFLNLPHTRETSLFQFVEIQLEKMDELKKRLKILRGSAVSNVVDACINSLLNGGYIRNEKTNEHYSKISFIEAAKKRNKVNQLSRFLRLTDYISIFLLLELLENTYIAFFNVITQHTKLLPTVDMSDDGTLLDSSFQPSYIAIDVILSDAGNVTVDPGIEIINFIINKIQNIWEEGLREILESHTTMTHFESSMGNVIDCKGLKWPSSSEVSSRFWNVIKSSLLIENYKSSLAELLNLNTTAVQLYCKHFNVIETFYKKIKAAPSDMIQKNESSELFRNWCFEYKMKEEEINEIIDFQSLGIFLLILTRFKNEALSLINNHQNILGQVIPQYDLQIFKFFLTTTTLIHPLCIQNRIGKSKVEILLSKISDATTYLDTDPTTADSFANYIEFIDNIHQQIDNMEIDADYIKELYDITEEYDIQVDAGDFANYLIINVALTSFKIAVAEQLKERDKLISRFNEMINDDIRKLTDQVSLINELILEPWLLDPMSDANACLKILKEFDVKLEEYTKIMDKYNGYQKAFDLEMIRFDILNQVRNEIYLRHLLWECIIFWTENSQQWYECDFNDLNLEEITSTTEKYIKNVGELERGLGRKSIVLNLKENVNYLGDKLPTINCLRNKHLRRRHWLEIEAILNYKFKPDTRMTMALIENLGAFAHFQALLNISERASSEANQEAILNKLDDV